MNAQPLPASFHITNLTPVALKELVQAYFGLVKSVAHSIAMRNTQSSVLTTDDLFQYGMLGLIDAIERFDPHRGAKFETFAVYRIKGAILDGLRSADELSRSMRKKQREIQNAHTDSEYHTMMKLKMNVDEYHSFMQETEGASMNTLYSEVSSDVLDSLPDDEQNNPFEIVSSEQTRNLLIRGLEKLPERERLVVTLYYYEGLTFREIGKILRLSESRVFQIHAAGIQELRSVLIEHQNNL